MALPGGTWPLKVGRYLDIQPVTKMPFSRVFFRALARRLNFEMTLYNGVFQKYHSVDRPQINVGFLLIPHLLIRTLIFCSVFSL